ncbi:MULTISPECIES: penicillin-binding protein activator [Ruegeria]|jgi:ABC-type branched-subunit amino acid transport system substrate-binding protein|uniref:ABC transporter substrate-binding protein n=1 Tax=Ruegeria atlantica TaxID=81569 RepID=A0AA90YVK2_9RHOB|nr:MULTISPECIES: penicillin-binding protein activator [Ruegeria]NOC84827.1 ABC transporter substrate-binding protein [Ruegeria sp. HKCCD6428]NOD30819.1 ABC transporter substrate-binding protein [Ruegeria atlantica]NOD98597.1 ABC transporter substrate-binding protein [Ruegeria sp. HKCCD6228]NOE19832.1 ABC transporter substrate-binding protein [Ruegeria atlantica]QFT71695.1 Penicillin-binding protein activator LpoA [Ruegeria sp. THAF33]
MFTVCKPVSKLAKAAIALTTAAFLAACEPGGVGGGPSIDTSNPVPVALLVPRSGDAALAQSLENAARMAMSDLPNVKIDLRVYDTAGNPTTATAVAQQAVAEGAKIIVGPVYAQAANAAGLAVLNNNVNVLSFSNNTSIAGGNVFVLGPTFENTANRLVNYAGRQGKTNTVIVHSNDAAGQVGQAAIANALANSRVNNAGTVGYDRSQQGVINSVPTIKATVDSTGADSIFMTATTAGALPLFSQLLPEAGVSPATTQFIGLTRWDIPPQTLELPGVQGGWFALPDPSKAQAYRQRYNATYGEAPHPISGLAYDGIAAIGALVSQGKSNALTGAALTQNAGFQGVGGIFRLRPNGTNERGLAVATIQNKQVVVIDPAPQSFSGAGF